MDPITYYNKNAKNYFEETHSLDMSSLYKPFLELLPSNCEILDAGCGSGRDTKKFSNMGYNVTAFDASFELAQLATKFTGQLVLNKSFSEINFVERFEGVWACASLVHLSQNELADVMRKLATALKKNGILYTSFKFGTSEIKSNSRTFYSFTENSFESFLNTHLFFFEKIEFWKTMDNRPGRDQECWLNVLLRKKF